jgi:hypothetical protein
LFSDRLGLGLFLFNWLSLFFLWLLSRSLSWLGRGRDSYRFGWRLSRLSNGLRGLILRLVLLVVLIFRLFLIIVVLVIFVIIVLILKTLWQRRVLESINLSLLEALFKVLRGGSLLFLILFFFFAVHKETLVIIISLLRLKESTDVNLST